MAYEIFPSRYAQCMGERLTVAETVLSLRKLSVEFSTPAGTLMAVDGVSWDLKAGEVLGIVGESGSGKSVSVMSILGLIRQPPGRIVGGEILYEGRDLLQLSRREMRMIRGRDISIVFQDPMSSLNPVLSVGYQISEALLAHKPGLRTRGARDRTVELLGIVGVADPESRFDQYPHEFSGGMRQRAMIAMAIAHGPRVLIADEPTTALDVTIQAQVLDVLRAAQRETNAATILITHDLGLLAEIADRVVVMYAGSVVEMGNVRAIFHEPRHPYTLGLMRSIPRRGVERMVPIMGQPPSLVELPGGCAFHPRCHLSAGRSQCTALDPTLEPVNDGHWSACHFADEMVQEIGTRSVCE